MTIVLLVLAVWFALLAAFVALKARQPKLAYPAPTRAVAARAARPYAA